VPKICDHFSIDPYFTGNACVQVLVTGKSEEQADAVDFNNIVDQDDRHAEEYVWERLIPDILYSTAFQCLSVAVIIVDTICNSINTIDSLVS
jgi:hypothetical protein